MPKSYQISNNVIFAVNSDGSITKHAIIEESGQITVVGQPARPTPPPVKVPAKQSVWGYWLVIVLLLLAAAGLGAAYLTSQKDFRREHRSYLSAQEEISSKSIYISQLTSELDQAQSELSLFKEQIGRVMPMVISDIEIANIYYDGSIETGYGSSIYSYNTMYLKPRISYMGLAPGRKELKVKLYKPDGSMSSSSTSPYGCTYSNDVDISTGSGNTLTLSGWGGSDRGHWSSGTYRMEIWYRDICLKTKSFTIY